MCPSHPTPSSFVRYGSICSTRVEAKLAEEIIDALFPSGIGGWLPGRLATGDHQLRRTHFVRLFVYWFELFVRDFLVSYVRVSRLVSGFSLFFFPRFDTSSLKNFPIFLNPGAVNICPYLSVCPLVWIMPCIFISSILGLEAAVELSLIFVPRLPNCAFRLPVSRTGLSRHTLDSLCRYVRSLSDIHLFWPLFSPDTSLTMFFSSFSGQ